MCKQKGLVNVGPFLRLITSHDIYTHYKKCIMLYVSVLPFQTDLSSLFRKGKKKGLPFPAANVFREKICWKYHRFFFFSFFFSSSFFFLPFFFLLLCFALEVVYFFYFIFKLIYKLVTALRVSSYKSSSVTESRMSKQCNRLLACLRCLSVALSLCLCLCLSLSFPPPPSPPPPSCLSFRFRNSFCQRTIH